MELLTLAVMVFFVAVFVSMLGLGGGFMYVPLFYWLGIDIFIAIPTALLLNTVTSSSAAITYLRKRMVDLHTAVPFIITSIIGAPVGAYFTKFTSVDMLLLAFSVVLVIAGTRMIFSKAIDGENETTNNDYNKPALVGISLVLVLVLGFVIGMAVGLLGIGGGTLIVPVLVALGFGMKRASATSGFIIIFSSAAGFLGHLGTGHMDVELMIYTAIAAFIGAQVGSHFMYSKMKSRTIKQMFGVVLWIMVVKIVSGLI